MLICQIPLVPQINHSMPAAIRTAVAEILALIAEPSTVTTAKRSVGEVQDSGPSLALGVLKPSEPPIQVTSGPG